MARNRTYPIAFKRQLAKEFLAGSTALHGLARRHDVCRNLIVSAATGPLAAALDDQLLLLAAQHHGMSSSIRRIHPVTAAFRCGAEPVS